MLSVQAWMDVSAIALLSIVVLLALIGWMAVDIRDALRRRR